MRKRTACWASALIVAVSTVAAPSAQAKFVAVFEQVGANVEEIGDGTIDVTDLGPPGPVTDRSFPSVGPANGTVSLGALRTLTTLFLEANITGPDNFGSGDGAIADGGRGGRVGVGGFVGESFSYFVVFYGYKSGAPISNSSFYLNASFASLGMTPGVYVWSWGSGAHADSLTIDIAVPAPGDSLNRILSELPLPPEEVFPLTVPESSTWAMMLVGFAGLGYAAARRKGVRRSGLA
jgi:hypothetical protein